MNNKQNLKSEVNGPTVSLDDKRVRISSGSEGVS